MPRFIVSLGLLALLAACGFEPVYATRERGAEGNTRTPFMAVEPIHGRMGQILTIALEDRLNPEGREGLPYRLSVALQEGEQPALIEPDGSTARYTIFLESSYRLIRMEDGKQIDQGVIRRNSSYPVTNANYADYVTREHAFEALAGTLADEMALRLAAEAKP